MKNIYLYIVVVVLVVFGAACTDTPTTTEEPTQPEPPVIEEVEPVESPTTNRTPEYQFKSTQAGEITYGGSCSSSTTTALAEVNTNITFNEFDYGTYSDCTIVVTNSDGLKSNILNVTPFTIKVKPKKEAPPEPPVLKEVTPVENPTFDRTPNYTFSSTKEGNISYRGGCSSNITYSNKGNNSVTFNEFDYGTYSDCTITVTSLEGEESEALEISAFTVKMKPEPEPEPEPEPIIPPSKPSEPEDTQPEELKEPVQALPDPEEIIAKEAEEIEIEKDADESVEAPKPVTIITAPPEEIESAVIEMGMVYFDYDKSEISPEFAEIIQINYEWISENPDVMIQLEGHCDERGTNEYNLALGERRAKAIFDYLVTLGANPSQFTMVSFGEERPAAFGSNEADWGKNRRVEFTRL